MDTEEYKGYTIKIEQDDVCDINPRKDWDNAGTMVCWHNRYNLGDEQPEMTPREWLQTELGIDYLDYESARYQFLSDADIPALLAEFEKDNIVLPLFLYDHSGITMSTCIERNWYHAGWDSSRVGWIYISKADAVKEWGKKLFTRFVRSKAEKGLLTEVKVYDQHLTGDVWGFMIADKDGEEVDSCWGFYGYDYCLTEAKNEVDELAQAETQKQWEAMVQAPAMAD
jgi:hypothetical protein